MSNNVSLEHTIVIINGHRCEGWAKQNDALSLPDIEVSQSEVGPDGLQVSSSTGMRGGPVIFKFQANSRSRAFFGEQMSRIQRGAAITFDGTIQNPQTGLSVRLSRGVLKKGPVGQTLGDGVAPAGVFEFDFETVLSNWAGFRATPAPVVNQ